MVITSYERKDEERHNSTHRDFDSWLLDQMVPHSGSYDGCYSVLGQSSYNALENQVLVDIYNLQQKTAVDA